MQRIECNYSIEDGLTVSVIYRFGDCDKQILDGFWAELEQKTDVLSRLMRRGLSTKEEILKEYLICYYGGSDNRYDLEGCCTISDYAHCGNRGHCPDEGYRGLCSSAVVNGEHLSKAEIAALQYASLDFAVKQIADRRNRSAHTIQAEERSIRRKLNVHGMAGAVAKSVEMGITHPSI